MGRGQGSVAGDSKWEALQAVLAQNPQARHAKVTLMPDKKYRRIERRRRSQEVA